MFEIRRLTKLFEETKNLYPDVYVYAIANSVYPYLHKKYESIYNSFYKIPEYIIEEFRECLIKNANQVSQRELEMIAIKPYKDGNWGKIIVKNVLKYFYLSGCFENEIDNFLKTGVSVELHCINKPISADELHSYNT